jgi:hypothetical protein
MIERPLRYKNIFELALSATLLTGCARVAGGKYNPVLPTQTTPAVTQTIENPFTPTNTLIPTASPTETPTHTPYHLFGIDFLEQRGVNIVLTLSNGLRFSMATTPTLDCDTHKGFAPKLHTSCEYQFLGNPDMVHFVHSGFVNRQDEMPAEYLRHWLEDSTIDYPATEDKLSPSERIQRMNELVGSPVQIIQGDEKVIDLKVLGVVRVPPDNLGPLNDYCPNIEDAQSKIPDGMKLNESGECVGIPKGPVEHLTNKDIMAHLIKLDPGFAQFQDDGEPQLFIIFCGWRIPEEDKNLSPRPSSYSWSRYVIVIGK